MPEWIRLVMNDMKQAVDSLTIRDFTRPTFIALWLLIIFTPLIGVDRRDPIAASVYVLFCTASGIALIFALPQNFTVPIPMDKTFFIILLMAVIAGLRWFFGSPLTYFMTGSYKIEQKDYGDKKDGSK